MIAPTADPATRTSLARDLRALGLRPGGVVLLHSSLSALGWVCGGSVAVVQALLEVLGPDGTLVVPTHTSDNSEPAQWRNPPAPEHWWPVIRDHQPAFDPAVTPSVGMGAIAETARTWPAARRSDHPHTSFAAVGADAAAIVAEHRLDSQLGEQSPLARIYDRDGQVLLLGVGHRSNTSLHLAEYRQREPRRTEHAAAVDAGRGRRWTTWSDVAVDAGDFDQLGADFQLALRPPTGRVGAAHSSLLPQRALVDFAVGWLQQHRPVA